MSTFQCSPALHRRNGQSCLDETAIQRLIRTWNNTHPRHKIPMRMTRKNGGAAAARRTSALYNKLRAAMKKHYKCDTEFCMVRKMPIAEKERDKMLRAFRPPKPDEWDKDATMWLDSFNIEDVMNQYEQAYPDFEFIGPVPIDFDSMTTGGWGRCIVDELCKLDIRHMETTEGTKRIGIVFNLDPHDKPGSHWVCAYIDIPSHSAYYFDSYGFKPQKEIVALLDRLKTQGITNIYYNDVRHQRKGSECGMYCLFCIVCLLEGRSFYDICTNIIKDDTMNAFRDLLFAEEHPRREAIQDVLKKHNDIL